MLKVVEKLDNVIFSIDNTEIDKIDSDEQNFSYQTMILLQSLVMVRLGLVTIDPSNINLDDDIFHENDSELIIHVRLMTWRYKIKRNKARAKYQCMIKEKNCGMVRVMQKRLLVLKHFRNICRLCRKQIWWRY